MKNRISSFTRWPMDLEQVIERSKRDLDFTDVMRKLGLWDESLIRISTKAASMYSQAQKHVASDAFNDSTNWRSKKPR